jgi:predicted DNA-binding transcriptional regulator AlpA
MQTELRLLTPHEVAKILEVSPAWVRDHATRRWPRLPVVRLGHKRKSLLRFRRSDVEKFISDHLVESPDAE